MSRQAQPLYPPKKDSLLSPWLKQGFYARHDKHVTLFCVDCGKETADLRTRRACPIVYSLVQASGGQFLAVSPQEIRHAQTLVSETVSIWICEVAACTIAGYLKLLKQEAGTAQIDGPVVINLTGGDRYGLSD